MQLTKFTHSCVRLDDGDRSLVFDPGTFSEVERALDGADAVLITHEHPDHLDVERVRAALAADSRLRLWAPPAVAHQLQDLGEQVVSVEAGTDFEAAGFRVRAFGGQHALIHPVIPMIANLGYLVDGLVFHPGDSLVVPEVPVPTLLLPTSAPWLRVADALDFAISVRAATVHPIHDGLVQDAWTELVGGLVTRVAGPFGVQLHRLAPSETVTLQQPQQ
jgi:L-ascorbate metabolism protein UlaG (beta-lactamase superfamily)